MLHNVFPLMYWNLEQPNIDFLNNKDSHASLWLYCQHCNSLFHLHTNWMKNIYRVDDMVMLLIGLCTCRIKNFHWSNVKQKTCALDH